MDHKKLPPLTTLRSFVAAARRESLRGAAHDLGVTPSAISHQVSALEDWIGAPVFIRSVRQVHLTPLGRQLFERLASGFDTITNAVTAARSQAKDTVLRVSALPLFTSVWLIPRLERFEARTAKLGIEVRIQIDTTNTLADFDRGDVDVAIRNVLQPSANLVARKLLDLRAVPLCTPSVARNIASPEDLTRATLIHISAGSRRWPDWLAANGCNHLKARSHLSFDTVPAALEAAAVGRGIMLGLDPLIWDAPASRGLVSPFKTSVQSAGAYFVVYRRAERSRHAVRAFADWIVAEMREDVRRLRITSKRAMQGEPR